MLPTGFATATMFLSAMTTAGFAQGISVEDAYARSSSSTAKSGAAFMQIVNSGQTEDRLIAAESEAAARTELSTHLEDTNGVMRMIEVEDGFAIPAGEAHSLERGGDHVMLMGLKQPFVQGESISVTLIFENAEEVTLDIPIDLDRKGVPHVRWLLRPVVGPLWAQDGHSLRLAQKTALRTRLPFAAVPLYSRVVSTIER